MSECKKCYDDCVIIDRDCMVRLTPLNNSIHDGELEVALFNAQELYVKGVLRGTCFDEFCAALVASRLDENPVALNNKWQTVFDLVKPALAWYTYFEWFKHYGTHSNTPKGAIKKTGENAETISADDSENIQEKIEDEAKRYMERLKEYLFDNLCDFECLETDCKAPAPYCSPITVV